MNFDWLIDKVAKVILFVFIIGFILFGGFAYWGCETYHAHKSKKYPECIKLSPDVIECKNDGTYIKR